MKTRFHYIQHVPYEGPGVILEWADRQGYIISCTRTWLNEPFPLPKDIDWLVLMGGPMSVLEEDIYPWLIEEKKLVAGCISSGRRVIGICLGAQMIARSLGAEIRVNGEKEIGWYPLELSAQAKDTPHANILNGLMAFHWHGETFDLPAGALHLCSSIACENQAFQYGANTLALQFHLEVDEAALRGMVSEMAQELMPSAYVMKAEEILERKQSLEANNKAMFALLQLLAEGFRVA